MHTFIFDIGKTNIKGLVLDSEGETVWATSRANVSATAGEYPHFDVEHIWDWLQAALRQAAALFSIEAINVSTHGACAVLLNADGQPVFPVMDYEFDQLEVAGAEYSDIRPPFEQTLSPDLAFGLNLGRQIWWLKSKFPDAFQSVTRILMYPQYWVWKLTGVAVTELTSLGCHTDLWEPVNKRYSDLVKELGIEDALPPLARATDCVGIVKADLAKVLGLPASCRIYAGVHDSNAGYARYLASGIEEPFTVISTGTWIITMSSAARFEGLDEARDMLANVNVLGEPLACARFMGGREFQMICDLTGASLEDTISEADIAEIVSAGAFVLPPFEPGSGPFRNSVQPRKLTGPIGSGKAAATLYLALMIDYELGLLGARGRVLIGGASRKNPLLCNLLAQLRPEQDILMADDSASTIRGAWCLTRWHETPPARLREFKKAESAVITGLLAYRDRWLTLVVQAS